MDQTHRALIKCVSTPLGRMPTLEVEVPDSPERHGDKVDLHMTEAVVLSAVAISAAVLRVTAVPPMEMRPQGAILAVPLARVYI